MSNFFLRFCGVFPRAFSKVTFRFFRASKSRLKVGGSNPLNPGLFVVLWAAICRIDNKSQEDFLFVFASVFFEWKFCVLKEAFSQFRFPLG